MRHILFIIIVGVLAVSGCKKDSGPTDGGAGGTASPFEFIAGRSWTYSGQSYQTNGTPIPNSSFQTSLTVQTTGQPIGGVANAAILRSTYTQGSHSETNNLTVAYNQNKFMIYNGTASNPDESPSFPGWSTLFDFTKDSNTKTVLSFDSTYQLGMRSGRILRDRVRYNATIRYLGEETISAFNTSNIACSKYLFTFTYDATIDTGGIPLYNGNVINASSTIWFSPSIGFVKVRGDGTQLFTWRLRDLQDLKIVHNLTSYFGYPGRVHISPGVWYLYVDFGGGVTYEWFGLSAGTGTRAGYSIIEGFSKNF
jgi:hypothetical protein